MTISNATSWGPEMTIPGTWNARDIGGRAVPRGGTAPLRTGVLLRTASLSGVTTEGKAVLEGLGLKTVFDLRGEQEVRRDGVDVVPSGTTVLRRGVEPSGALASGRPSADPAAMIAQLMGGGDVTGVAESVMTKVYEYFVTDPGSRATVGQVLTELAHAEGLSDAHCSAGKDRTGWVVALVQYVCGIDEDDIMAEYLLSAHAAEQLAESVPPLPGITPGALFPLLTVKEEYLAGAWSRAIAEFSSIDGYLRECGLSDADRDRLADRLVV